jgi:superfamily II DNA or RNA helicase/SOS-response transcriptional repressor LexA
MKFSPRAYPGFDKNLLGSAENRLLKFGFIPFGASLRGRLFVNEKTHTAVLLDHEICNIHYPYNYTEYTKEQNSLMHRYSRLFRFTVDNSQELDEAEILLETLLLGEFNEDKISVYGVNRELQEIDPTLPEAYFEQAFIDCFGREKLDCVLREFPVIDINGVTRWVDYYIRREDFDIAIEKNGICWHHPLIIGPSRYKKQLIKQNSLVAYGAKVFRWSLQALKFTDNFSDEMKLFFGPSHSFLLSQKVSVSRKFKLFSHQENVLEGIQKERNKGHTSFLVVLPTGTGKTEVLIADYSKEFKAGRAEKTLVMVPSRQLKMDHIEKLRLRLKDYNLSDQISVGQDPVSDSVIIQTYSWLSRHYQKIPFDAFDYIAVDEAHHSVAPTVQKVIQHFTPNTLIGFTATDQRLDEKKIEIVFGKYETNLSLQSAIEKGMLAPIKAFRVKSNIDLSQVRFNGKDYMASDLQKKVIVPSRDQLIIDVLLKYFVGSDLHKKQGIIFCVSVIHAETMAKLMKSQGISAMAVSSKEAGSAAYIKEYQDGKIQFLTTCSLLNEGWDSPQTAIIVMARPTMSKVLYTQQLGRGTRKYPGKEALYVIDVVDNYGGVGGFSNRPWSVHALLGIQRYLPWGNMLNKNGKSFSKEEVILSGLYEQERSIEHINIFTFENKYPDHINDEQLARELFVSTGTVKSWVSKGKITPAVTVPVGRQKINYFAPGQIDYIISDLKLKRHDETTQYDDFFEFIDQGDFSMSYKMVMFLSLLTIADQNGECNIDRLLGEYVSFYRFRFEAGLKVDRQNCPYSNEAILNDPVAMKRSLLQNPFEKFERKRFMYHCKDLNHISFSNNLWTQINNSKDLDRLKATYFKSLIEYYEDLDRLPDESELRKKWKIPEEGFVTESKILEEEQIKIIDFEDIKIARFKTALPLVGDIAAGEPFRGFDIYDLQNADDDLQWIEVPYKYCNDRSFIVRTAGDSMEPNLMKGDYLVCEYHRHRQENHSLVIMGDFSVLSAGEVAIKRISESEKHWVFKSDNPSYDDILIEKEYDDQYPILGIVIYNLTRAERCR